MRRHRQPGLGSDAELGVLGHEAFGREALVGLPTVEELVHQPGDAVIWLRVMLWGGRMHDPVSACCAGTTAQSTLIRQS